MRSEQPISRHATSPLALLIVLALAWPFRRRRGSGEADAPGGDDGPLADAARIADRAAALARVEFAALFAIDEERREAAPLVARDRGRDVPWAGEVRLDLDHEPSGVASAYHDAATLAVYDAAASPRVSARLVERTGARSAAYVPVIAGERVVGVLVVVSLARRHAFPADELKALEALAAEAAPILARAVGPASAGASLERDAALARVAGTLRGRGAADAALALAAEEVGRALAADRCVIRAPAADGSFRRRAHWHAAAAVADAAAAIAPLVVERAASVVVADVATSLELQAEPEVRRTLLEVGSRAVLGVPAFVGDRVVGVIEVHRGAPGSWGGDEVEFVQRVAAELAPVLDAHEPPGGDERRGEPQAPLLRAAQALARVSALDEVVERTVREAVAAVGADAAECALLDEGSATLRCVAAAGPGAGAVGREITRVGAVADALASPGAAAAAETGDVAAAAIVGGDRVRGVLVVGLRGRGRIGDDALRLLEALAALASVALAHADERKRQSRTGDASGRIAAVLAEPLALPAALVAVAQAATEAFDGRFAAVVTRRSGEFELVGAHRLPDALRDALEQGLADAEVLRLAADDRRILAASRIAEDARFSDAWRELGRECRFEALIVVPVETRAGEISLVLVFFAHARALRDADVELAQELADAARAALERSALFEAERTSRGLAQQLARTGSLLATELDPAAVLDEVVEHAPALVGADACVVRVVDGDELVVAAASGEGADVALGARSETVGWLSGEVFQSRRPVTLEDAAADPTLASSDPLLARDQRAFLGVPLVGPEASLHGVLALYARRPRAWRAEEVEAVLALAANTSAALSNAELYQRVALEKERNAAILENVADGIVAVDRDGNAVLWNRAAEQMTGVPASEALGRPPQQVLGRALAGEALVPIVRGGGETWLSVNEAVMRDPAGLVAGRIFAFRDISGERLVEEMKSEFVATVSHELRGPLTSIYGFAETLLREDVLFGAEERRVFLGYIASETERLTRIVDALLNVARLDTGDLEVNVAPVDVAPLVADVVTGAQREAAANGHRFVLDLPAEPLAAEADAEKLRQVLAHLLENAIKYSPEGGTVTVAARRKTDTVEFHVADEGVGIPATERERIFRKFYRVDHGRGGTGVGLFIVERLVDAMGGRIWVEPAEGRGSRFAFELPAARV